MKFRKKPDARIFEAEQFHRSNTALKSSTKGVCNCQQGSVMGHVHTIHAGQVIDLVHGDWVMPEPDGEHYYPIKDEIFKATYEPVENA